MELLQFVLNIKIYIEWQKKNVRRLHIINGFCSAVLILVDQLIPKIRDIISHNTTYNSWTHHILLCPACVIMYIIYRVCTLYTLYTMAVSHLLQLLHFFCIFLSVYIFRPIIFFLPSLTAQLSCKKKSDQFSCSARWN